MRARIVFLARLATAIAVCMPLVAATADPQEPVAAPQGPPPATRFFYPTGPTTYVPPPVQPAVFDTSLYKIRVVTLVNGLSRPFGLAFLPDGGMLVTERTGQLRIIRNGVLDPRPVAGVPTVVSRSYDGLMDIALHPRFAENKLVYLTYTKPGASNTMSIALARGRFDGSALQDVRDLLVTEKGITAPANGLGSRIAFDNAGMLFMGVAAGGGWERAQDPSVHQGKVLRLRDDGSVPPDNPFVGRTGYRPEIFTMGHRNPLGLAMHPQTGLMYENENGPQGGDEINILSAGKNYGWPVVSEGRDYSGTRYPSHVEKPGMEPPIIFWAPAIAISGMTFYTGEKFPKWKGDVFVGSLAYAHLERVTFNAKGEHINREWMLLDLKQRIRDVRQGPDGLLYLLTDASYGALLRIEPAE